MSTLDYLLIPIITIIGGFILLTFIDKKTLAIILGTIVGIFVLFILKSSHQKQATNELINKGIDKIKKDKEEIVKVTNKAIKEKTKELQNAKRKEIINRFINAFGGDSK